MVCFTIRQLTWQIFYSVPNQFSSIYFVCNIYQQKSIKNTGRLLRGSSERFILKSSDVKLPADMHSFLRNGANKEMLFNLIEVALKEGKKKLGDEFIYLSNVNHCLKITQHEALFNACSTILFQIKVFCRKINGTTQALYLMVKISARSSFVRLRFIRQINIIY